MARCLRGDAAADRDDVGLGLCEAGDRTARAVFGDAFALVRRADGERAGGAAGRADRPRGRPRVARGDADHDPIRVERVDFSRQRILWIARTAE